MSVPEKGTPFTAYGLNENVRNAPTSNLDTYDPARERDAALTLRVTPQITATNTVIMRISVENASPDFSRAINGIPPIDTQRALTQVLVGDGDTTVIGGIYVSREQASQDRTPGLHRIPLLGWLFQRNEFSDESRELLIFITPKIMRL